MCVCLQVIYKLGEGQAPSMGDVAMQTLRQTSLTRSLKYAVIAFHQASYGIDVGDVDSAHSVYSGRPGCRNSARRHRMDIFRAEFFQ